MEALQDFIQQLARKSLKAQNITGFEIYAESNLTAYLSSGLDARGRWSKEIEKKDGENHFFYVHVYGANHKSKCTRFEYHPELSLTEVLEASCRDLEEQKPVSYNQLSHKYDIKTTGLEIWDPRYPNISDDDRKDLIDWNMEVIKSASARAKGRVFRMEETEKYRYFYASDGRSFREKSTQFSLYGEIELMVRPPRRMGEWHISRHFADVASRPISIGIVRSLDSGERLTSNIDDEYAIVLEAKVVASLIQAILPSFEAKHIRSRKSFLHRYIGKRIGSKKLHIIDDGSLPNGVNTRAFDMRGIPSIPRTLVCEGNVQDFYIDPTEALQSKTRATGHSGVDGALWPGNIIVKAGRRSLNMIIGVQDTTIFCSRILQPIVFDMTTGEVELVMACSMLKEEKRRRIYGARIKSPVIKIFDAIEEITSTQKRIDSVDASDWVLRNFELEFLESDIESEISI